MSTILTFPGFVDVHVHFRDPGPGTAETTASGLAAARRGGFAGVVTMPNTDPATDSPETMRLQRARVPADAQTVLFVSAALTRGRLGREVADLEALADAGAVFFTDDGSYVSDARVMEEAMRRAAALDRCVCQHALDPRLVGAGVVRDCPLARRLGLAVIPPEAETDAIRRDLSLVRETGCRLHVQHISTAAGVELVRAAQREGLPVTAEATPHHLLFACDDIPADDAAYKMAPPLGTRDDRAALREGVKDGVLMFATDHAPHPAATKSLGFARSANGILGLETALPVTWAVMVEEEGLAPGAWARAWSDAPRALLPRDARAALEGMQTRVEIGEPRPFRLDASASLSRNCPYDGMAFRCRAL